MARLVSVVFASGDVQAEVIAAPDGRDAATVLRTKSSLPAPAPPTLSLRFGPREVLDAMLVLVRSHFSLLGAELVGEVERIVAERKAKDDAAPAE